MSLRTALGVAAVDLYHQSWRLIVLNVLLGAVLIGVVLATVTVRAAFVLAVLFGPAAAAVMHCAVTLAQTEDLRLREAVVGLRRLWRRGSAPRPVRRRGSGRRCDRGLVLRSSRRLGMAVCSPDGVCVARLCALPARPLAARRVRACAAVARRVRQAALVVGRRPLGFAGLALALVLVNGLGVVAAIIPFLTLTTGVLVSGCRALRTSEESGPGRSEMASVTYDHVTKRFGETAAVNELELAIQDGEFMVLVGPSGCGKSTALRMLAGLEKVSDGRILIGDRVINNVAPQHRDIAMVFQSYALYPHMTVYDNLAFGLRNQKVPRKEIESRVHRAVEILDLGPLIKRKPKQLSGGQRQRVALGRAIVREPVAFLMDEPLSNLDAKLRVQTRAQILKLQNDLGTTTIYVTHDQVEAMTMGDRIAVMNFGVLQQVGSPEELYRDPRNLFVAGFIGSPAMNLVPADVLDGIGGHDRIAGLRPEHIDLGNGRPDAVPFDARVEVIEYLGDEQLVHVTSRDTELQAKLPVDDRLSLGEERTFTVPRDKVLLFDPETQERVPR